LTKDPERYIDRTFDDLSGWLTINTLKWQSRYVLRTSDIVIRSQGLDDSRKQTPRAIGSLADAKIAPKTCIQIYSTTRMSKGRGELHRLDSPKNYFRMNVTAQIWCRLEGVKGIAK
jgi:hypothetical protein